MATRSLGPRWAIRLADQRTRLLTNRAQAAQQRRDWAEAEQLWRQVTDRAPDRAGAWVQLGNMLNELERRTEAVAAFRQAGEIDPTLAHAPAGVAGVYEREGRWKDAGDAWLEAIELLTRDRPQGAEPTDELMHAYTHAAMAARKSAIGRHAQHIMERATAELGAQAATPEGLVLRAKLLPPGRSAASAAFLRDFVALLGTTYTSQAMIEGDLFQALIEIAPLLEQGRQDPRFLATALELYDSARLWREAMILAEWQADLEPASGEALPRAFRLAAAGRRIADARRLARRHARQTGELKLIHELAELYEQVRQPVRARLLTRFLMRRWPHSRWHVAQYIQLTAATRSLPLADHLIQQEQAAGHRDYDLERAYCRAAFAAGYPDEARLRLLAYLRNHDDEDSEVLLGYAIANSVGLDAAADHFRDVAVRRMQPLGALVGQAHMEMRRRNLPQARDRWRDIAIIYPGFGNAGTEQARCAYDMGDIAGALSICEAHLARLPNDVGMGEFYAWLLTMNGRYEQALPVIATVLANAGLNWQAVDLGIICSSQLGTLDEDWPRIAASMPRSDSAEAVSRFYHVIRILIAVGRRDLAIATLAGRGPALATLPWAAPYLRGDAGGAAATDDAVAPYRTAMEARWSHAAAHVRSDFSDRLDAMSDLAVDALLAQRPAALPVVHVVNKFEQPRGGSELHALDLAEQIGRYATTHLWAPEMPHPDFTGRVGVSHVDPARGIFPRGGVLVFVGVYFPIAHWIHHVQPDRVIFLYNTFEAPALYERIAEVWQQTGVRAELLYCGDIMGEETGLPGRFEPSPTDLDLFSPAPTPRPQDRPFTLGRHSRDVPEKHGRDDWKVYQQVSDLGGESTVLGGACMSGAFPAIRGLSLMKARKTGIPEFLQSLDAYFYRTSTWIEPWGRVVIEAMACGLPVLVHSAGGYAQAIRHEQSGLIFDTTDEAVRLVRRLMEEPELARRLGEQARIAVCDLLSQAELRRMIAFYLLDQRQLGAG